jgi:ferredoxin-NADP reductase
MPVQVAGPMGSFCADVAAHPRVVFIAGGVGITPFLSVLRHFLDVGADTCVLLLWANKTVADAFAARELEGMARRLDLTVVHAISRESPPAPMGGPVAYAKGRIAPAMLQGRVGLADEGYYLCGPPQMQDAVLELLESMGVDRAMVATERFTFVR